MRIKPLSRGFKYRLWRLFHPLQYKRQKELLNHLDEMHEYKPDFCPVCGRRWSK